MVPNSSEMNRREVLRKTALTGGAALTGVSAVSATATADHDGSYHRIDIGQRVRLDDYASTWECCPPEDGIPDIHCQQLDSRPGGSEGVVSGVCEVTSTYDAYNVVWDDPYPRLSSWVMEFSLQEI